MNIYNQKEPPKPIGNSLYTCVNWLNLNIIFFIVYGNLCFPHEQGNSFVL